jgi:hypothetical protein
LAGKVKIAALTKSGDYEKDDIDPDNKDLWLFSVYQGTHNVREIEHSTDVSPLL